MERKGEFKVEEKREKFRVLLNFLPRVKSSLSPSTSLSTIEIGKNYSTDAE